MSRSGSVHSSSGSMSGSTSAIEMEEIARENVPRTDNASAQVFISPSEPETKVYKKRWVILAIFVIYSMSNAFQWIQFSIITNIIMKYYNVSADWVNWTSMIYMITYIPLVFPASWILSRWGLRVTCIVGVTGTCLGAWIKVAADDPDKFHWAFIGQTLVACSQVFVLNVPSRLAAVWFGPDQISSACSIGVFGNQLGVAAGFLLPPIIIKNHDDIDLITQDLRFMYYSVAIFCTFVFVAIVTVFEGAPELPPSQAQAAKKDGDHPFFDSLKIFLRNKNFLLLLVSYGIMVGVFYAISTLLNQVLLFHFPGHEEDVGRIGLTIVVSGMIGSIACGIVLDKTHKFKLTTLVLYIASLLGLIIYMVTLNFGWIWLIYVTSALLGFFMTGFLPVGFEFAAEITYPQPEGTSAGLLNASSQVFGIVFTIIYQAIFSTFGDLVAHVVLGGVLIIGVLFNFSIEEDLRRQKTRPRNRNSGT